MNIVKYISIIMLVFIGYLLGYDSRKGDYIKGYKKGLHDGTYVFKQQLEKSLGWQAWLKLNGFKEYKKENK